MTNSWLNAEDSDAVSLCKGGSKEHISSITNAAMVILHSLYFKYKWY